MYEEDVVSEMTKRGVVPNKTYRSLTASNGEENMIHDEGGDGGGGYEECKMMVTDGKDARYPKREC